MRVWVRGYKRDSGPREILDEGVLEAVVERDSSDICHYSNTPYLKKSTSDGSITLSIAPRELSGFGGEYRLYVHLTEDEIAKLFLECFPNMRDVITRVAKLPPAERRSNTPLLGESPEIEI
jgi:hypothetical protein